MKTFITHTLTLATLALSLSAFTGCVIVIDPNNPFPVDPITPKPSCAAIAIQCEPGFEPVFAGEDENDCPIDSCEPITCESDGDCNDPNLSCLPTEDCVGLDAPSATEGGDLAVPECEHICQFVEVKPDLCAEVNCEEGNTCVIEVYCSPVTGECDERAACVPVEGQPIEPEPQPEEEEEEEELEVYCFGDWDCEEDERCVFPGEEGLDEDANCGVYNMGICVPRLL